MNKALITLAILLFTCNNASEAKGLPLDSIKSQIVSFLVKEEGYPQLSDPSEFSNCLIVNSKHKKQIEEGNKGIYLFSSLSEHSKANFILIEEKKATILNMTHPDIKDLNILLEFMKRHSYSKKDVYYYIDYYVYLYNQ